MPDRECLLIICIAIAIAFKIFVLPSLFCPISIVEFDIGSLWAVVDNNIGIVGVNMNVKIMALKFLEYRGTGNTSEQ